MSHFLHSEQLLYFPPARLSIPLGRTTDTKSKGVTAQRIKKATNDCTFYYSFKSAIFIFLLHSQTLLKNVDPIVLSIFYFLSLSLAYLVKTLAYPKCNGSEFPF